ncbi:MAG: complex I subunit 4 family protein, partial [Pyrinomonadaceae bacterium]
MFTNNLLSIVTWLPAVGAILILGLFKKEQNQVIKKFATGWLVLDFVVSLWLMGYDRGVGGFQFLEDHQWIPAIGARYQLGVDGVSVLLIVLTTFLGILAALSSWNYIQKREKEYYILLLVLQSMVLGVFSSMDLFLFYLFFEVGLVPMYFLIGVWGGENRLYAAIKFFLYTLVGSVVMLLGVIKMYFLTQDTALTAKILPATVDLVAGNKETVEMVANTLRQAAANGTGNFSILYMQAIGSVLPMGTLQVLLFFAFALGFAIKVPMWPFHTWLPDAHVEAPTAGSVVLAGVLLKLGTYGFYRFNLPMFPKASMDEAFFGKFGVRSIMIFLAIVSII